MPTLKEQRESLLSRANNLVESAKTEGRDLSDDELETTETLITKAEALGEQIARAERTQKVRSDLFDLDSEESEDPQQFASKRRLGLAGLAPKMYRAMRSSDGQKDVIAAGTLVVPTELLPGIQTLGRAPLTLLEAIPAVRRESPVYRFLQETVFTPSAAPVAPGASKPVTPITIKSIDSHLKVVATISDPIDRFVLDDGPNLSGFLSSELSFAVSLAIENQVVNGDGAGENFTGFNHISGVQTVTGAVDLITGLRTAITSLQTKGYTPSFFAVNPTDFQTAQTTRNTSGAFDWAIDGTPVEAGRQQAWGVTVIPSPAIVAGTAWAVADGAVQLSTDGQMRIDWGTPGDSFSKNQLVLRAETRANLDALSPGGLAKITLAPVTP